MGVREDKTETLLPSASSKTERSPGSSDAPGNRVSNFSIHYIPFIVVVCLLVLWVCHKGWSTLVDEEGFVNQKNEFPHQ